MWLGSKGEIFPFSWMYAFLSILVYAFTKRLMGGNPSLDLAIIKPFPAERSCNFSVLILSHLAFCYSLFDYFCQRINNNLTPALSKCKLLPLISLSMIFIYHSNFLLKSVNIPIFTIYLEKKKHVPHLTVSSLRHQNKTKKRQFKSYS